MFEGLTIVVVEIWRRMENLKAHGAGQDQESAHDDLLGVKSQTRMATAAATTGGNTAYM